MPVWPKFVYTFNVSVQTAATQRKLRDSHLAPAQQNEAFGALISQLAATTFWRERGIEKGMTYGRFQSRVPLHRYEQIASAVAQMQRGEKNVLWPGACTLFGRTSGTSNGAARCLPVTESLLAHLRRAGFEALLYYNVRAGHSAAFRGRHLYYSAPALLSPVEDSQPQTALAGEVSGIAALNFPDWAEKHLYEPGRSVAEMADCDPQLEAIATRAAGRNITLIAGVPGGVAVLAAALREKFFREKKAGSSLHNQWPNLECFVHSGASLAPHAAELRAGLGPEVSFHEIYAASEGVVAAQDTDEARGLRVMADMGLFFEFVPVTEFDDLRFEHLGMKAVPLADVKPGIDYVILVTTPGGLARYVLGDVVRFTSVTPPRLLYVGGTELRLNAFGENVTERAITEALVALCQRREWSLVNFHVAPYFTITHMTGQRRGGHEWWVELRPGTVITPTGPQMAVELDAALRESNAVYAAKRASGLMDPPVVRLVMPGVFEHWLRFRGKWGGQHKMPRCRSDRQIADEFAFLTNFARD